MSNYDAETRTWHGPKVPYKYSMDVMFGDILLQNLMKNPERILQICADDDKTLSCDQLKVSSIRVAQNLQKIGIKEDDVVGLISHHSHLTTCLIFGCILAGAIINPLDGLMGEDDIYRVYDQSKPKVIVCDPDAVPKLQSALKNVDFSYRIYSTCDAVSSLQLRAQDFLKPTGQEENFKSLKFSKPSNQKLLAILCSSGTTGAPKSVCYTHAGLAEELVIYSQFSLSNGSKSISFSPVYWATGFFANLTGSFFEKETRIVTARKFSPETFIEIVEKHKITSIIMAPYLLSTLLYSQKLQSSNIQSLQRITVGGAIVSKEARRKFDEILPNVSLTVGYGMTEGAVCMTKPLEYRNGLSVGSFIMANVSIKIIDEDGNNLKNGEVGEICTKRLFKFFGYFNNPDATEEILDHEGFIKTGDLGYFNDNGMLSIVDRKKDILKYKGIHLNPSDIENVIESIEGVQCVSVVGIPDECYVNLITAAVIKREGFEKLTEKEIIDFVASKLPDYKHLSGGVYFFNKFPTTINDKVVKRSVLKEILKIRKNMIN